MSTPVTSHDDAVITDGSPRRLAGVARDVPPVAFGCWRFVHDDLSHARQVLEAALDAGLTLVDTADVYGLDWGGAGFGAAEALLGRVLAETPRLRQEMVLATKGGIVPGVPYDASARWVRRSCTDSLRRLGVDHVDLWQLHRPDLLADPAEVAGAMAGLVRDGLALAVGISNHDPAQHGVIAEALSQEGVALASTQPELSVAALGPLRDGTLARCALAGVVPLAWSPLGGGRLATGQDTGTAAGTALSSVLDELAEREGTDRAGVALAFVLSLPGRPVAVVGTQQPERLRAAADAVDVRLTRADCYRLVEASEGAPLP